MKKNHFQRYASQALALCLMMVGLVSCGQQKRTPSGLVLITSADNPPFQFYQVAADNSRHIAGFDIALAKEITKRLGYKLEIKDVQFNSIVPALQAGRADLAMASLSVTEERKKMVDFSLPYFETRVSIITLPGVTLKDESDLKGKTIGVQLGSSYEKVLQDKAKVYPTIKIHSLNQVGELIQELRAKRIDGVITETSVAHAYVGSNRDIEMSPLKGFESSFAIAFPKGSSLVEKFNGVIESLEKEGVLEEMKKEWFRAS